MMTSDLYIKPESNLMYPKIVLTSDRTWMSSYNSIMFAGFAACFPKGYFPDRLFFRIFSPPVESGNGIVKYAPYGLRKVEAALLEYGFREDDIAIVNPNETDRFAKHAKVVGICGNDIMGKGPTTRILTQMIGVPATQSCSAIKFRELLDSLNKHSVKKIVGGPGAWQLLGEDVNIDCIVIGEGELVVGELFEKALNGEHLPEVVEGEVVDIGKVPLIRKPSICGLVEIARGCGRGCKFCSPTMRNHRCQPINRILKEIQMNVNAGQEQVMLHAEDILRYRADGLKVNPVEVERLFESVAGIVEPESIGMSHITLSSALQQPRLIERISEILDLGSRDNPWRSAQTGIETASTTLIRQHMLGKAAPFKPEQWRDVVLESFQLLHDNNWVPCATLIMGLPGEKEDDVINTIELVRELKSYRSLIIPLFFVPLGKTRLEKARGFTREEMSYAHWELLATCVKHSTYWIKILAKDALENSNLVSKYGISLAIKLWERIVNPYMDSVLQGEFQFSRLAPNLQ